jgi:serine/threonine protein kinase
VLFLRLKPLATRAAALLAAAAKTRGKRRDVLRACLHLDPKERLTADELMQMEWFRAHNLVDVDQAVEVRHSLCRVTVLDRCAELLVMLRS